ncbi:ubiquitin-like-specific protease ESD4 [Musa acuminata AAA Group]|uniref:ubiquitin-like-specific protease ESD4 n=1 Tax=Musa acuminata AAA Group TaxID=214697 RepID=UPI0031E22569
MGALTKNRKRRLAVDLRLPFSSHPVFDVAAGPSPPSKKAKIPSPPADFRPLTPPAPVAATPAAALRRFPPAAPLPRPVHAPQRILRAFGLGSVEPSRSRLSESYLKREGGSEMENLVARFLKGKKAATFTPWRTGKREDALVRPPGSQGSEDNDGADELLGLDQYKKLVKSVQEGNSVVSDLGSVKLVFPSSPFGLSDRKIVNQKLEETLNLHVANTKVDDAGKLVSEWTPSWEEKASVKRGPLYKELHVESARKHDSKLRDLELQVELAEKKIFSFRLVRQEQEKKFKEDVHEVFLPLTDEEEEDVYRSLNGRNSREILAVHEASNIHITREVLQCLSCNAWLNDEVINLYLELLKEREKREPKKFLKCHFFSTFFYKKLISGRNGYDYKAVRRWTTQKKLGYSLIECDKIFVPIHKEVHWCLAVIDVKEKKFLYLDSLGGIDTAVLKVLAKYLMDEVEDKTANQVDTLSWKLETVDDLPLQKNGWDCGMFMLKYTDFYSRGLSLCFSQDNMPYFRKRTAKEILRLRAE